MQAKNIEEFFGTLQQSTVEAWKKHLKVSKKSEHETLNDFYEDIVDVVDSLIEDYMSIHGKVEDYVNLLSEKEMSALEYLETLREFTRESADELLDEDDTELFSDVDNIISVMDTAIYKLKELEGGKDDKKTNESFSLMNYLSESLGKSINEARQIDYSVAFIGTQDAEGIPYTVRILVDKEYQRDFEKFLEDEQDNIFIHAEGGDVEY
jgi:hypothetical protein